VVQTNLEYELAPLEGFAAGDVRVTGYSVAGEGAFAAPDPETRLDLRVGELALLRGYRLDGAALVPGQQVTLRLQWEVLAQSQTPLKVFVHLIGPDGQIYGQRDDQPQGGGRPTTRWTPGTVVEDTYVLPVAADAPPGGYRLLVGMYDLQTMTRLPLQDPQTGETIGDHVTIEGLFVQESE
jgi:hypothetical protein